MSKRKLKNYMVSIAKLYGAKVIFEDGEGGSAELDGRIRVGIRGSNRHVISTFCHELTHHINQVDGKYPIYHQTPGYSWKTVRHMSPEWTINYAYRAEMYTDRNAKKLCALWFPGVKYHGFYMGDRASKAFVRGYYWTYALDKEPLTPSLIP